LDFDHASKNHDKSMALKLAWADVMQVKESDGQEAAKANVQLADLKLPTPDTS
jgi:hypothetical protein